MDRLVSSGGESLESGFEHCTFGGEGKGSAGDLYLSDGSLSESSSDDDFVLSVALPEQCLAPSACFTEKDVLGPLEDPTPWEDAPPVKQEGLSAETTTLQGPGVLRGVRLPPPKRKEEKGKRNGKKHQVEEHTTRKGEGKKKSAKGTFNYLSDVRPTKPLKVVRWNDLMNDEEYKR